MPAASAIARRSFADARARTLSFALLFAVSSLLQAVAYREGYPMLTDRLELARTVGENTAVRLLYGQPHNLLSVGGYTGWRVGGSLVVFAALWGLLGAVRAMRAEEDAGRAELVLAGVVGRRSTFAAQLAAIAAGAAVLWLAAFVALAAGQVPLGGSAFLALAIVSVVPVFAGVGALASQLASTKRLATALSLGVLGLAFVLRAAADTASDVGWLRWLTPLGWAEELRPFADPQPAVLLLPAATAVALLSASVVLAARRDIGSGLLPGRDSAPPRLRLLRSPSAQALRSERGLLLAWLIGVGSFALVVGVVSEAVRDAVSDDVQRQLEKLGPAANTPTGYLGFAFLFVILAISLFCCFQLSALREEEAEQRLETLLSLPVSRSRWLAGRLVIAASGAAVLALVAGAVAWAGAASQGADVTFSRMLEAGANCLPAGFLFLGLGALAFALVPRAATAIAYALVAATFLWETLGALLDAPGWLLAFSPFHHVGLVPAEPFETRATLLMLAIATAAALAAAWAFRRRDLLGA